VMRKPFPNPLTRHRHIVLTLGTGLIALLSAVFLIGAPPLPSALGVAIAVGWLIWRAPAP
jgi:hypothetical protein